MKDAIMKQNNILTYLIGNNVLVIKLRIERAGTKRSLVTYGTRGLGEDGFEPSQT